MTMSWPQGVTDTTALPFAVWRVLEALASGSVTSAEPQVQEALSLAEQFAARAARQEQPVTEQVLIEVSAALIASVGPMGSVIIEDVLDDLPSPALLSALLRALGTELEPAQRQSFGRQLRERGLL